MESFEHQPRSRLLANSAKAIGGVALSMITLVSAYYAHEVLTSDFDVSSVSNSITSISSSNN